MLLSILAYSQVGYYLVLRNNQESVKNEMKEKVLNLVKEEEMSKISLTDNLQKISWEENNREFSFDGEMYDLIKQVTINGKQVLYCVHDTKEKEIVDHYNGITKHNSSSGKKMTGMEDVITLFCQPGYSILASPVALNERHFPGHVFFIPATIPQNTTPPPRA